jgi:phosphotransferase system IIB component
LAKPESSRLALVVTDVEGVTDNELHDIDGQVQYVVNGNRLRLRSALEVFHPRIE